ncbi:MAG: hypothetical protein B6I26_00625 [Desulfobacteraceae bacterium 4572_130]|nr:MAG: hypothetical protein B6I26_00625 [Desulfobacteraceae bacterium 4572_130]
MKKIIINTLFLFFAVVFLFGCSQKQIQPIVSFSPAQFDINKYQVKADNIIILFDASSSMSGNNFMVAKEFVNRMAQTLPEMGQNCSLISFGHSQKFSINSIEELLPLEKYSSKKLSNSVNKITFAGGTTPIFKAFDLVTSKPKITGQTALIIISDAKGMTSKVEISAQSLKEKYGSSICFYPVLTGDNEANAGFMQKIADIGKCGFSSNANELLTSNEMKSFVEQALITLNPDSDNDGVFNNQDECPNTLAGTKVKSNGCWAYQHILFDYNNSEIQSNHHVALNNIVEIYEQNSFINIIIEGHTDNIGSDKYNIKLSTKRANAVSDYLVDKGIPLNKITCAGYGFSRPAVSNDTKEGRSQNRRANFFLIKIFN